MSFLRDILHTPKDVPVNWKNFHSRSRDQYSYLTPSAILADSQGVLIQDFSNFDGIINNNANVPFIKSLTINTSLEMRGIYKITLSGRIYNLADFVNSGSFNRLFNNFNQFRLYFGWGQHGSYPTVDKYGSFYRLLYCNLITYKIKRYDTFSYSFDLEMMSNIMSMERDLNIEMFNISFTFEYADDLKINNVPTKKKYTKLSTIVDKIISNINLLSLILPNDTRANKQIEVRYEKAIEDVDDDAFVEGSKSLGDLKIYQESMQTTDLFKGNLRTVFDKFLKLTHTSMERKVTFFIDEEKDKTIITFYNVNDEFSKFQNQNSIVVDLYHKNSIVKNVEFNYEKPLYALNLFKVQSKGQYTYGSDDKTLEQFAKQVGWDFAKLKELVGSGKTLTQVATTPKQVWDPTVSAAFSKQKTKDQGNILMAFVNLRCELETLGFCGFHPGQGFLIRNDALFEGKYILNELTHQLDNQGFWSTSELICLEASNTVKNLFGIS